MKKLLGALILTLVLCNTVNAYNFFEDWESFFTDHNTAINFVQNKNIMSKYSDGFFHPERNINRAELSKIIITSIYGANHTGANCFPDVKDDWYAPYVCKAKTEDIVSGYDDGTFKPDKNVSIAEALKLVLNAYDMPVNKTEDIWYKPYIDYAKTNGLVFVFLKSPDTYITRGEISEVIYWIHELKTVDGKYCSDNKECGECGRCVNGSCKTSDILSKNCKCEIESIEDKTCQQDICPTNENKICVFYDPGTHPDYVNEYAVCDCANSDNIECLNDDECKDGEICKIHKCVKALISNENKTECLNDDDCGKFEECIKNSCESQIECLVNSDCADDKICKSNKCVNMPAFCIDNTECINGYMCKNNDCTPVTEVVCKDHTECPVGYRCSEDKCVLKQYECEEDSECDGVCVDNICVDQPATCDDNTDCDEGAMCKENKCIGVTEFFCREDSVCPVGYRCKYLRCAKKLNNCEDNDDCETGYKCEDNECMYISATCKIDTECPADYICKNSLCIHATELTCINNSSCPDNFKCSNFRCTPEKYFYECHSEHDCDDDMICEDHYCIEPIQDCKIDYDCNNGFLCRSERCILSSGRCSKNDECPYGETCEAGYCVKDPDIISPECVKDTDCDTDEICIDEVCKTNENNCNNNNECNWGEICRDNVCQSGVTYCDNSYDCPPGYSCIDEGCTKL